MNKISLIMVTYNSVSKLGKFFDFVLSSLLRERNESVELIAVDNASRDGTLGKLAFFDAVVKLERNVGLPAAYNIGANVAHGKLLFFMNDDVILGPNTVKALADILEEYGDIGAVQPVIVHRDGYLEVGFDLGLSGFVSPSRRARALLTLRDIIDVDVVAGCCIMVRREAFEGFEDSLFWGYDDVDFSWRLRQRGWRLVVTKRAYVIHYGSATWGRWNPIKLYLGLRNQIAVYIKNMHPALMPLGLLLQALGILRIVTWRLRKGDYKSALYVIRALHDFRSLNLQKKSNRRLIRHTITADAEILIGA